VLAGPIVATIYGYHRFDRHDVFMASASLMTYAIGLTGFALVKVLAPAYFARQETRAPVRIGIVAVGVNLVLNVAVVLPWAFSGGVAPHAGLALSTSLAAIVNAALLLRGLRRRGVYAAVGGWAPFLLRVGAAVLVMGAAVWLSAGGLPEWTRWSAWGRAWHLALLLLEGVASYAAALWLLGLRPRHLRLADAPV